MSGVHEGSDTVPTLGESQVHGADVSEVEAHGGFEWTPNPVREVSHRTMSSVGKKVSSVLVQFEDGTYIHTAPANARYVEWHNEEGGDGSPSSRKKWTEHEVIWQS